MENEVVRYEAEKERQEELRPDKEKLIAYVNALFALEFPNLKDLKSKAILANIRDRLSKIVSGVNDAVGRL